MNNPVTNSLRRVKEEIPKEILEKTFMATRYAPSIPGSPSVISLDQCIREKIIDARVRVDCNLKSGQEHTIPLEGLTPRFVDSFNVIYSIPKTLTMGKSISTILSVGFGNPILLNGYNQQFTQASTGQQQLHSLLSSALTPPVVSTANAHIIEENTVLVSDVISVPRNLFLRCWLENDYNFNNIKPGSYEAFADLVILATKAYIYNNSVVTMDKAYIYAGGELGRYAEIVNSFSEANENYKTALIKWAKVAIMNDNIAMRRLVRRTIGGGWI